MIHNQTLVSTILGIYLCLNAYITDHMEGSTGMYNKWWKRFISLLFISLILFGTFIEEFIKVIKKARSKDESKSDSNP